MTDDEKSALDAQYTTLFGHLAGYLPRDRGAVLSWHRELKETVERRMRDDPDRPMSPSVVALAKSIESDGIMRMYIVQMLEQVPACDRVVAHIRELLAHLDHITRIAPEWEEDKHKRNFFPVSALLAQMMMTPAGEAAFRYQAFNDAIRRVLRDWCCFLNSENSLYVLNEGVHGWLSRSAVEYNLLDDFVVPDRSAPHWGWKSYNDFFHREIQLSKRRIAAPDDPKVIVSPNDGAVYKISRGVDERAQFWIKGEPYSLTNMLGGSAYLDRFIRGDVFQSYLSGADYHRWHSPIDGIVRQADVVDGLMFSNLEWTGDDIKGVKSQGYYTAVNTRGLTFIEADEPSMGMVCCMPVGITEISSITMTASRGDRVKKGDQLGYFSYGGSSVVMLFEPSAIDHFTVKAPEDPSKTTVPIKVNAQIALAR